MPEIQTAEVCLLRNDKGFPRFGRNLAALLPTFYFLQVAFFKRPLSLRANSQSWFHQTEGLRRSVSESSKLAGSKLASFIVCLHSFQCTPDQNNRFGEKCIWWKDLFIWNSHLCLCFSFYQLGLCSVIYTANEYSIYHFCIMIKDFSISFLRVILSKTLKL